MHIIQTSRLILTPYAEADRAHVVALHGDPVVMDYMKDSRPLTEAEATQEHARYLHAWARDGFGIFTVRNCADDQLIGECGCWLRGDKRGVSMRYLLFQEYWGQGFGSEMAAAATAWLFKTTHVTSFWAVTQARNKASVAVLRRLGAVVTETAHMGKDGLWRFDITRDAWQARPAGAEDQENADPTD